MNTPTQHTGGESATPRTDVHEKAIEGPNPWSPHRFGAVPASFARQLERETATLHAQIARLQQREGELVGALKTIASYDEHSKHGEGICPYGCDTPHIARAALQSVAKEGEQ